MIGHNLSPVEHNPKHEEKLRCYYCNKFTYDITKFITHLDWHYYVAVAEDSRLPWQRVSERSERCCITNNASNHSKPGGITLV
jgi:hypothetical protein